MMWIIGGIGACALALASDVAAEKTHRMAKQVTGALAAAVFAVSLGGALIFTEHLSLPPWTRPLGAVMTVTGGILLYRSLVYELRPARPYRSPGHGLGTVTTGTYALVRHPGVLWFSTLLVGLVLLSHARLLLIATPLWIAADVIYVLIQDRFFFPRTLAGYRAYQRRTPFLIPTRVSFRRCLQTWHATGQFNVL
jgi:protein-S-isoprenylcysteine O-methyltransferase Ste14